MTNSEPKVAKTPSQFIDERIKELGGWREKCCPIFARSSGRPTVEHAAKRRLIGKQVKEDVLF